jgi:hypothetical protein
MSDKEKQAVLETFKNLPRDVQMGVIAGKTLADLEQPKPVRTVDSESK